MMSNGWNAAQQAEVLQILAGPHAINQIVRLLDLDHNYVDDLTLMFAGGQVNIDDDADVSRSLDITFRDPFRSVQLDPDSPSPTGVYINHMISVIYQIISPLNVVYDIPVFCGPIESVARDEVYLDVKCLGKESLALDNMWTGKTYKGKPVITDVIQDVMLNVLGEVKMDIPDLSKKANKDVHFKTDESPWAVMQTLANRTKHQLFYDGRGTAVMRKSPSSVVFTLTEQWLSSAPVPGYDLATASNAVEITGGNPKGPKKVVVGKAVAPRSHPLNPHRLARGNPPVPRYINPIRAQNTDLNTQKEVDEYALDVLNEALLEAVTIQANVGRPVPMFEEQDLLAVATSQVATEFRARKFTIPLVVGQHQSIGYIQRLTPVGMSPVRRRVKKKPSKKRDRKARRG